MKDPTIQGFRTLHQGASCREVVGFGGSDIQDLAI